MVTVLCASEKSDGDRVGVGGGGRLVQLLG